jgi:hypothetical protein
MNSEDGASPGRFEATPRGGMTRRALLAGAAGAAALGASTLFERPALAQSTSVSAGMARAAGAAASAEAEVRQRLAAAMGAVGSASANQGVSIAQGAAANAMANAHGVAETNGAAASAAAASGVGAATKGAVAEAVVILPTQPKRPMQTPAQMRMPKAPAMMRMAAPRGGGGGGGGRNRRMRALGGAAPAKLPSTGVGVSGFNSVSTLFGVGAAIAAGLAWASGRAGLAKEPAE